MAPSSIGIRLWRITHSRNQAPSHRRDIPFTTDRRRRNAYGWRLICFAIDEQKDGMQSIYTMNAYVNEETPLRATEALTLCAPLTKKKPSARTETRQIMPSCNTSHGTIKHGIFYWRPRKPGPKIGGRRSYPYWGTKNTPSTRLKPRTSSADSQTFQTETYVRYA